MLRLLPNQIWGDGKEGEENRRVFLRHVDSFVRLRRFENMTLHNAYQGLKVSFDPITSDPRI